jgi:ribosomal protein RSM22 (predicted rRNA methylase)
MNLTESNGNDTDGEDKPGLRLKALELYTHLRTTGAISTIPTSYRDRQALLTSYDPPTSLAYLAGLMPSIYGATVAVLTATSDRLKLMGNDWVPDRVIDFGSGTGSAAWAIQEVWGPVKKNGEPRQYIGLDASRAMVELSSTMLGALPAAAPIFPPAETRLRLKAATYNLPIPAEMSAMAKMQLGPTSSLPGTGLKTIALAAFTLGDLGTREKRKDVVREIWDSGAEVIVLIDRGTPQGSRIILEAREQLIMLGQRSLAREKIDGVIEAQKGCFVLSPVRPLSFHINQVPALSSTLLAVPT